MSTTTSSSKASTPAPAAYSGTSNTNQARAEEAAVSKAQGTPVASYSPNNWVGSSYADGRPVPGTITPTVATANQAQTNFNNKQADFTGQLKAIQDQNAKLQADANQKALSDAQAKQTQFTQQQQQAELNLKQQAENNKANAVNVASGAIKPNTSVTYDQAIQNMNNAKFSSPTEKAQVKTNIDRMYGVNQTNAPTGNTAPNTTPVDPVQQKLDDTNSQIDSAYNDYKSQINQIRNGTIPLTAEEQAILTSTQNAYDQAKQTQQLANKAYVNSETQSAFRSGQSEYAPEIGAGTIAAAITYGVQKIAELDGQAAKAISDLKQGFMDKDYKMINDSYDKYNGILKDRKAELVKMQEDAYSHAKDARDYALEITKMKQDQAYKASTLAIEREKLQMQQNGVIDMNGNITSPINTPTTLKSSDINPLTGLSYSAENGLSKLPPATAATIRGLLTYTGNPANISIRGNARQQLLSLAHQIDPTYDESQFAARSAYNKNITSGTGAQAIISANKSISHLLSFADTVSKLPNISPSTSLNKTFADVEAGFGNGTVQTNQKMADVEANGVKDELAKFFKGTGVTDIKSIDDWAKNLNTGQNPNQLKGTVQGAITLLAGQLNTLETQYQTTMGKPAGTKFLQPETIQKLSKLKNQGYTVDILGVYYTDKNAYINNGGSEADLDKAYQTLKANGIDTTPDNILQAAQLQ